MSVKARLSMVGLEGAILPSQESNNMSPPFPTGFTAEASEIEN